MVWWLALPIVGLRSFAGHLGLTLVFVADGALRAGLSFYGDWTPDIPLFPKILF